MSSGFLPLAFVAGVLIGAAGALLLRRRAAGDEPSPRRNYGLKIAALTAIASIALTLGVGYAVVRYKFRKRAVSGVSVDQAVKTFRARKTATPVGDPGKRPAPGVYTYMASGYYQLDVPVVGKDRRELRAKTVATLTHTETCWQLSLQYFAQHTWAAEYCATAQAPVAMAGWKLRNQYFGRKVKWSFACSPGALVRAAAKPGDTWKQTCRTLLDDGSPAKSASVSYVGREQLNIGDASIATHHVQRVIVSSGQQSGRTVRHLWFGPKGMLVRLRETSKSSGVASFESSFELTLAALTPAR